MKKLDLKILLEFLIILGKISFQIKISLNNHYYKIETSLVNIFRVLINEFRKINMLENENPETVSF